MPILFTLLQGSQQHGICRETPGAWDLLDGDVPSRIGFRARERQTAKDLTEERASILQKTNQCFLSI